MEGRWEEVVDEILIMIFSFLSFEDLKNLSLVCKNWRRLSFDPFLRDSLFEEKLFLWNKNKPKLFSPYLLPKDFLFLEGIFCLDNLFLLLEENFLLPLLQLKKIEN